MLKESIEKIRQAETLAEQDKTACRVRLQQLLTEAQQQADAQARQAREILRQEREDLLAQAEAEAALIREDILQQTAMECQRLKALAGRNLSRAIQTILSVEV